MAQNLIQAQARCIAHEIRNHISICDVYTEIIKRHLKNAGVEVEPVNNALECIGKSLKIMSNSLLDLKSLNNLNMQRYSLQELLFQALEMAKVYVQDKCINFTLDAVDSCEVMVDESKFLACVVNLIKNAIESIESNGKIDLTLICESDFARVRISNNGAMIPDVKQCEIFEQGVTTKKTGSGLGLYICKNNLAAQNAELNLVQSTDEKTVFEIKIPIS